jgi:hypothetical protein
MFDFSRKLTLQFVRCALGTGSKSRPMAIHMSATLRLFTGLKGNTVHGINVLAAMVSMARCVFGLLITESETLRALLH